MITLQSQDFAAYTITELTKGPGNNNKIKFKHIYISTNTYLVCVQVKL